MSQRTINELMAEVNKAHPGLLVKGSDLKDTEIRRATTGSLVFDLMLGGGWPLNCWNELVGQESAGKTVMALKTIAANQALNPDFDTLWVAAEDFVPDWAEALGIDLSRTVIAQTTEMEEAYQVIVDALDARAVDAVVLDSYPALSPGQEVQKSMDEFSVGLGARLTGQFMRKSNKAAKRSLVSEDRDCLGLIINQWREKIGVMYGDPRTTPGGKAKNYAYFTRVEVARDEWIESGSTKVGMTMKAKAIKNKTAPPQRTGLVDFYFADAPGFHRGDYDTIKEVANTAIALDVVERRGAFYNFDGEKWQGKDKFTDALRSEVDLKEKIEKLVRDKVLS